jgi:hypothetical protein
MEASNSSKKNPWLWPLKVLTNKCIQKSPFFKLLCETFSDLIKITVVSNIVTIDTYNLVFV